MPESLIKFRASHFIVRIAAAVSVTHFLIGSFSRPYYEATRFADPDVELLFAIVLMASTVVLPVLVGLEFLWLYAGAIGANFKRERNSILVDGCFAAIWCVTAWALSIYAAFHFVPL
jgi:hypothetical protein